MLVEVDYALVFLPHRTPSPNPEILSEKVMITLIKGGGVVCTVVKKKL
jgi:hypothetical protein